MAVAGITAYRTAFGEAGARVGEQPGRWGVSRVFVVPNPSGLHAHETVDTLARAYAEAALAAGGRRAPPAPLSRMRGPAQSMSTPSKSSGVYSRGSTSTIQLPELSRIRASTPYGRSWGSWRNSTPRALSSS